MTVTMTRTVDFYHTSSNFLLANGNGMTMTIYMTQDGLDSGSSSLRAYSGVYHSRSGESRLSEFITIIRS